MPAALTRQFHAISVQNSPDLQPAAADSVQPHLPGLVTEDRAIWS
jgi:hypothetical protein